MIKINNFAKEITIEELNELDIDLSCISICDKIRKLGKKGDFKINDIFKESLNNYATEMGVKSENEKSLCIKRLLSNIQPDAIRKNGDQCEYYFQIARAFPIIMTIQDNLIYMQSTTIKQENINHDFVPIFPTAILSRIDDTHDLIETNMDAGLYTYPIRLKGRPFKDIYIVNTEDLCTELKNRLQLEFKNNPDVDFTRCSQTCIYLINQIQRTPDFILKNYWDILLEWNIATDKLYLFSDLDIENNVNNLGYFQKFFKQRIYVESLKKYDIFGYFN